MWFQELHSIYLGTPLLQCIPRSRNSPKIGLQMFSLISGLSAHKYKITDLCVSCQVSFQNLNLGALHGQIQPAESGQTLVSDAVGRLKSRFDIRVQIKGSTKHTNLLCPNQPGLLSTLITLPLPSYCWNKCRESQN